MSFGHDSLSCWHDLLSFSTSAVIRAAALLLLSFVVEDSDLHLLELDHRMLQYCVCRAEAAWTSLNRGKNGFETEELLVGLSNFARLPYNRRLIVAKGKSCPASRCSLWKLSSVHCAWT